jgi:uncharacterized protein (TIGR03067 family)
MVRAGRLASLMMPLLPLIGCGDGDREGGGSESAAREVQDVRGRKDRIVGVWTNDAGQTFVFRDDDSLLWIFESGSRADTFRLTYNFDPDTTPNTLDLHGFRTGPLANRSLFGIVRFEDDRLACDFEPGVEESVRPKTFDPEETQVYRRVR